MIIHPVGAELFHADRRTDGQTDGRTDMTKLVVVFRNFANESKNGFQTKLLVRCFNYSISSTGT